MFIKLSYKKYITAILVLLSFFSCKKDTFNTSGNAILTTSTDVLKFDTVFTSVGSVTQFFRIANGNDQKLLLNSVKVMGGTTSPYKLNINGIAAQEATNIELAANDSMYVFVSVNINPNIDNLPFIVKDSVQIIYNGNTRFVQLEAFGQNANFLRGRKITTNTTWSSNLPYVILDNLMIDTNVILTLEAGCRIYCHANAPVFVDGTLIANGTITQPVIFNGDRLDTLYRDLPASWPGIYFRGSSKNNILTFTQVKNAYQAVVAEQLPDNSNPKVILHQCIIDNAYNTGLLCVNSSLDADNTLISNCGSNINIVLGGTYNLTNCTVASYGNYISHNNPVLSANDFYNDNGNLITAPLQAVFTNCIFWGEEGLVANEISIEKQGSSVTALFQNCLYRATADPANCTFNQESIKNTNPMFDSINVQKGIFNFHISNMLSSPVVNAGVVVNFATDLDNNNRSVGLPDIGCYERQ